MISPHIAYACVMDDLIKLLTYKIKNNNKREADILELAHAGGLNIINTLVDEIHVLRLQRLSEATKAKMLEMELKKIYNELYKRDQAFANEMIVQSYMPTRKQVEEQEVIIKNPERPTQA
jgi:hypothetical protein